MTIRAQAISPLTRDLSGIPTRDQMQYRARQMMTMVIITAGIDLSVGSLIALSAVIGTLVMKNLGGLDAPAWVVVVGFHVRVGGGHLAVGECGRGGREAQDEEHDEEYRRATKRDASRIPHVLSRQSSVGRAGTHH